MNAVIIPNDKLKRFIDYLEENLNKSIELFDNISDDNLNENKDEIKSNQHLSAVNFLQCAFSWFGYYIMKSYQPMNYELTRIIPQICSVDKIAAQEVTLKHSLPVVRILLSMWMLDQKCSYLILEKMQKVN